MIFVNLTMISFLDISTDKNHVSPRLSHTNVQVLNYLLRSGIFMSEDGQLRAAPLILDYKPLSRIFQDISQAIRAGNSRLARIDVSKPGFLARRDLPPVTQPVPQILPQVALPLPQALPNAATIPAEEVTSSRLSLEEEIDKFHFEEEKSLRAPLINISNAEGESDKNSGIHTPNLVITRPDDLDEEEDSIVLNKGNKSLRELMAARGKESTLKATPKSQVPPPPSQISTDLGLKPNFDLKKKRLVEMLEEGEMDPWKGTKQQKVVPDTRDRRSQSVDSREEQHKVDVCMTQRTWSHRLEVDGASIPWGASVREFQKGRAGYIAEALEQPLLRPKDMDAYRRFTQNDLFLSLKRDLAMVSYSSTYELKC